MAEIREVFLNRLNHRSAWRCWTIDFYVGNTDGIVVFPYAEGARRITVGRKLVDFEPGGRWNRSLLQPRRAEALCRCRLAERLADNGIEVEEGRAAVYELDVETGDSRIFAAGLRNRLGMAWKLTTALDGRQRT